MEKAEVIQSLSLINKITKRSNRISLRVIKKKMIIIIISIKKKKGRRNDESKISSFVLLTEVRELLNDTNFKML